MSAAALSEETSAPVRPGRDRLRGWYLGAVVVGSILIVWAAINQPYNQNELLQIRPYDGDSIAEVTSGTRQPPLGPVLGAMLQHLLGEGHLRQRLVPVLSGIGTLVVAGLLLRRLRLGAAGAFGLWLLATAPLMIRYSAYTRPYALPLFLMMLFAFSVQQWLQSGRRVWLVPSAVAAVALPLARVPEPTVFLLTAPAILAWFAFRRRLSWPQVWPPMAIAAGAVVLVGYPMYRELASESSNVYDPSISGIIRRLDEGWTELITAFIPLLAEEFPWWPFALLVVVLVLVVPKARQCVGKWWFAWPLLAAPLVFALAYHFMQPYDFDVRSYRPRYALFFVPGYVLLGTALASAVTSGRALGRALRSALTVLLACALLSQVPSTAEVVLENEPADFADAAEVLTERVPDDAIVLYDTPSPVGFWRQPFSAIPRYMGDRPSVVNVGRLADHPRGVPVGRGRPVYVLILDSRCSYSVVCNVPPADWDGHVPGWKVTARFDKFRLYAPIEPRTGRSGVIQALDAWGHDLGPRLGYVHTLLAAGLLKLRGHPEQMHELVGRMYREASPDVARSIRAYVAQENLHVG